MRRAWHHSRGAACDAHEQNTHQGTVYARHTFTPLPNDKISFYAVTTLHSDILATTGTITNTDMSDLATSNSDSFSDTPGSPLMPIR